MRRVFEAFTPPEWPTWGLRSRLGYVALLALFLGLVALGAKTLAHGLFTTLGV